VVRGRKGEYRKELAEFQKRGFQRVKIDGQFYEIADAPALDKKLKHDIDVVVDRIVVRADLAARLAESFETALELADGLATIEFADWLRRAQYSRGSRRTSSCVTVHATQATGMASVKSHASCIVIGTASGSIRGTRAAR
jgi:excinuclease UvrABC ATPase subunit